MPVDVTKLIAGPAQMWTATFGTAEPADSTVNVAVSASGWTDAGGTQDGVSVNVNREFMELEVDQIVDVPGRRITKRDVQVVTNMAEPTLENFKLSMNGGTIAASSGYSTYEPDDSNSATQPSYTAVLLDGWAPQNFKRRVVVRKCLSIETIESAYKKDEQFLYPVTWAAHYVSTSLKPFRLIDQTA